MDMDFGKMMADMADPRKRAEAELAAITDAYLDRLLKITTIAANIYQLEPDKGIEWWKMMDATITSLSDQMNEARAKFEKEHGEI